MPQHAYTQPPRETLRASRSVLTVLSFDNKRLDSSAKSVKSGSQSCQAMEDNETEEATSLIARNDSVVYSITDWFKYFAKSYRLSGGSTVQLCEHNARVADVMEMTEKSLGWRALIHLTDGFDLEAAEARVAALRPSNAAKAAGNDHEKSAGERDAGKADARARHASTRMRNRNNSSMVADGAGVQFHDSGAGGGGHNSDSDDDDDGGDGDDDNGRDLDLANIASGQMLTDYQTDTFGDNDFVQQSLMNDPDNPDGKLIDREAFDLKHELKEDTAHDDAATEQYIMNGFQNQEPTDEAEEVVAMSAAGGVASLEAQSLEEQTSHVLSIAPLGDVPAWDPVPTIAALLLQRAECGDVQTAVSMYLVLDHPKLKEYLDPDLVEHWFASYVEALFQFQLIQTAAHVIKRAPADSVRTMNLSNTIYFSNCTNCKIALNKRGAWFCDRCKSNPFLCSVCQTTVKGLVVWCQGCGHGGHLGHMKDWFKVGNLCPTGCGHLCEFQ